MHKANIHVNFHSKADIKLTFEPDRDTCTRYVTNEHLIREVQGFFPFCLGVFLGGGGG